MINNAFCNENNHPQRELLDHTAEGEAGAACQLHDVREVQRDTFVHRQDPSPKGS